MQDKVNNIAFSINTTSNILVTDNTVNLEVIVIALVAGRNLETRVFSLTFSQVPTWAHLVSPTSWRTLTAPTI